MGKLSYNDNDDIILKGGTDSTPIGNIGDRLKTDAAVSSIPSSPPIYACNRLRNGGSDSMAVNGSVTPVNFDWAPASGETWYIETIGLFLQDNGTTLPTNFGSISGGLTNGVDVIIRSNGVEYTFTNLKTNIDLAMCFRDNYYVPGTSGLFESADIVCSETLFKQPVKLSEATGDFVRFRIRDNLTGLDQFRAGTRVWRIP
jgi:hypothetical protein